MSETQVAWAKLARDAEVNGARLVAGDIALAAEAAARGGETAHDPLEMAYGAALQGAAYLMLCRLQRDSGCRKYPTDDRLYEAAFALCLRLRDQLFLRDGA